MQKLARKMIFCLSAGRTGTMYLQALLLENLPDALIYHEIVHIGSFGVDTPEISHLHTFNTVGNTRKVQEFWLQKLNRNLRCGKGIYAEASHILMKAGLVENAIELVPQAELHFVILKRDFLKVLLSYGNRGDFAKPANRWLWYLDPNYSRNILESEEIVKVGLYGMRMWYLNELYTRAYLYKLKYEHLPNVHFHEYDIDELNDKETVAGFLHSIDGDLPAGDIVIPEKQNTSASGIQVDEQEVEMVKELIQAAKMDHAVTAQKFLDFEGEDWLVAGRDR